MNTLIKFMFKSAVKAIEKKHGKIETLEIEYNGNESRTVTNFIDGRKTVLENGHNDKEGSQYSQMIKDGLGMAVITKLTMSIVPTPFSCTIKGTGFGHEAEPIEVDTTI